MSDLMEEGAGKLRLDSGAFYAPIDRRPWHEKLWWRLGFRQAYAPRPDDAAHWIITMVSVRLSWGDWLRMIVSGRLSIEVCVTTEHDAGRTSSVSGASVLAPRWGGP